MKYTYTGLGFALACAACTAWADSGNVTIGGNIATGIAVGQDNQGNHFTKMVSDSTMAFTGQEDLGNGSVAYWRVGTTVDSDGNSGSTWNDDDTYIGVKGAWGDVVMGRVDDTQWVSAAPYIFHYIDYDFAKDTTANWGESELTRTNTLLYTSPKFSGVNFILGMGSIDRNHTNPPGSLRQPGYLAGLRYDGQNGNFVGLNVTRATYVNNTVEIGTRLYGGFKVGDYNVDAGIWYLRNTQNGMRNWRAITGAVMVGREISEKTTAFGRFSYYKEKVHTNPIWHEREWALGVNYSLGKRTTVAFEFQSIAATNRKTSKLFAIGINQDF